MSGCRVVARTVNESASLNALSDFEERLFWRLDGVADEWHRFSGDPTKVRLRCLAAFGCSDLDVLEALESLVRAGLIELYCEGGVWTLQIVDGDRYLTREARRRRNLQHQQSRWPAKTPASIERLDALYHAHAREGARFQARYGTSTPSEEGDLDSGPIGALFARDESAESNQRRGRRRDLQFEALLEVCGIDAASLTESGRGAANRALRELKAVGATPEEIRRRGGVFRRRYALPLTPSALAKHWAALASGEGTVRDEQDRSAQRRSHFDRLNERGVA